MRSSLTNPSPSKSNYVNFLGRLFNVILVKEERPPLQKSAAWLIEVNRADRSRPPIFIYPLIFGRCAWANNRAARFCPTATSCTPRSVPMKNSGCRRVVGDAASQWQKGLDFGRERSVCLATRLRAAWPYLDPAPLAMPPLRGFGGDGACRRNRKDPKCRTAKSAPKSSLRAPSL